MWPEQQRELDSLDIKLEVILKEEKLEPDHEAVDVKFATNDGQPEENFELQCDEINHPPVDNLSNILKTEIDPTNSIPTVPGQDEKVSISSSSSSCTQLMMNEDTSILPGPYSSHHHDGSIPPDTIGHNNKNNNHQHYHQFVIEDDDQDYEEEDFTTEDEEEEEEDDPLDVSDFPCSESNVKVNSGKKPVLNDRIDECSKLDSQGQLTKVNYYRGVWAYKKIKMGTWIKYECSTCAIEFLSYPSILDHLRMTHFEDSTLCCDSCNEEFDNVALMHSHVCDPDQEVHPDIFRYCGQGQYVFRGKWKYEKATESATTGTEKVCYKCLTCGNLVRRRYAMFLHIRKYHNGSLLCDLCKRSFPDEEKLKSHLCMVANRTVRGSSVSDCGDGKFVIHGKWPVHLEGHFYICDTCGAKKKIRERIVTHVTINHHDRERFPCDQCQKTFPILKRLKKHQAVHLSKDKKVTNKKVARKYNRNRTRGNGLSLKKKLLKQYE